MISKAETMINRIIIVGVGGNGSNLFDLLIQYCIKYKNTKEYEYGIPCIDLIDPDKVEAKNLTRQRFVHKDIGKYKATSLREKALLFNEYSNVNAVTEWCDASTLDQLVRNIRYDARMQTENTLLHIFICVDNLEARNKIWSYFFQFDGIRSYAIDNCMIPKLSAILYDLGNTDSVGQVVVAGNMSCKEGYIGIDNQVQNRYMCGVDIRTLYPDMAKMGVATDSPERGKSTISCTQMVEEVPQILIANVLTAAYAFDKFMKIMEGKGFEAQTDWELSPMTVVSDFPVEDIFSLPKIAPIVEIPYHSGEYYKLLDENDDFVMHTDHRFRNDDDDNDDNDDDDDDDNDDDDDDDNDDEYEVAF